MSYVRASFTLLDYQNEWIEKRAEEKTSNKSQVVRELIQNEIKKEKKENDEK